ncbi:MAG: helix-turn-helix domain-containing protein, partial [Myxococcota bacterium]|nr:helix-turn-helix domain-containing protein [Myxococcota bacterium]
SPQAAARHRTLPNGEVLLMLHLGPTQRLAERDGAPCDEHLADVFLAGLQERPSTYVCGAAGTRVAALRLTPAGAWRLLGGLPQAELTTRVLELEAVLGSRAGVRALRERMGDAPDLGAALDHLEDWVARRLHAAPVPDATGGAAWALLQRSGGALRVDALAARTGVPPRRLHALFLREVGMPAKRVARILRFRRALSGIARAPAVDLARLARECGYYDQSHLYRDFRALAGMTPWRYRRAHDDGLHEPDVISG